MSQISKKFIANDSIADEKIRLDNDSYIRGRNAANSADVNILKVDSSDQVTLADTVVKPATDGGVTLGAAGKHFSSIFVRELNGDAAPINTITGIKPNTDDALALGQAASRFATVYAVQFDSQGSNLELNTTADVVASSNVRPSADTIYDLGSSANRFFTAFLAGGINAVDNLLPISTDLGVKIKSDAAASPGQIVLAENSGTNSVGFKAPTSLGSSTVWELPSVDGTTGQVLKTNGSGVLDWVTPAGSGANTALSNLITTSINQTLLPSADNTHSVGSVSLAWAEVWTNLLSSSGALDINGTQVNIVSTAANIITMQGDGTSAVSVQFYDDDLSAQVSIKAPGTLAASYTLTLPPTDGTANQVLKTDGSGVLDWVTPSAAGTYGKETFTLSPGDITNQYVDLAQVALTNSVHLIVKGGVPTIEGASHDYSLSYTGGAGGKTRLTFLNDLATGGGAALIAGDVIQIAYSY